MPVVGRLVPPLANLAVMAVLSVPVAGAESSASWPEFHGPRRDNISRERGLLRRWPSGGPRLVWKSDTCGRGYATVAIANGHIFTSGDFDREEKVIALDLDGKVVWSRANGRAWRGASPGARATPTVRDGMVYHMNPRGRLAAFRATDGREVWAVDLEERYGTTPGPWALSESVVVDGSRVLCVPGGTRGRVVAVDRRTGAPVWANTSLEDRAAYCSPIVVRHGPTRQLITFLRRSVAGVDVATGETLWTHPHRTPYDINVNTPVYAGGRVLVASGYAAGGRLLEIAPDGRSVRQVWLRERFDNCHGSPMLVDGHLYGSGCRESKIGFVCVEWSTGEVKWTDRELWKVTLTWADGLFYCHGHTGAISLLDADPEGHRVVGRFQLPSDDRYENLAHPVVCGGRLYLRQGATLFVFDVRERSDT